MASSRAETSASLADGAGRLTLAVADRLCAEALAAAADLGFAGAAAAVDAGGHLVAFRRADEAAFVTAIVAQRKAWTTAGSGMATDRWNALAADGDVAPILHSTGILAVAGGVPLAVGTRLIGGLGVSGGTAEQDARAARSALRSLGFDTV